MDLITDFLVREFNRIFPEQANYSELVRHAIVSRSSKLRVIMQFYQQKTVDQTIDSDELNKLDSLCRKAFRSAIVEEISRNSPQTSFMVRGFFVLNRHKFAELLSTALASEEAKSVLASYPFLIPLVNELSNPELLSSLVDP